MPVVDRDLGMKALRRELAYLGSHHARIGVLSGPGRGGNVQAQTPKKSPPEAKIAAGRHRALAKRQKAFTARRRSKYAAQAKRAKSRRVKSIGKRRRQDLSAIKKRKRRIEKRAKKSMGAAGTRVQMARAALAWKSGIDRENGRASKALDRRASELKAAISDIKHRQDARNAGIRKLSLRATKPRVARALTVAQVFQWHELGEGNNPKRSSIGWVAEHKKNEIVAFQSKLIDLVLSQKMTGKDALWFIGENAQSLVKARIVSGIPPALGPEYLRRKEVSGGKKTPLIWTGQLLNSIRYKVVAK